MKAMFRHGDVLVKTSSDNMVGGALGALPVPTLGAIYLGQSRARKAKEDLGDRVDAKKHFALSAGAGGAAGIAALFGVDAAGRRALNSPLGSRAPAWARRWGPLAAGAAAGAVLEPVVTNRAADLYEDRVRKISHAWRRSRERRL